jgi:hypothetical protein
MSISEEEILAEMRRIQDEKEQAARQKAIRAEAERRLKAAEQAVRDAARAQAAAAAREKAELAAAALRAQAMVEVAEKAAAEAEQKRLSQIALDACRAASFPGWIDGGCVFAQNIYPNYYPVGWNRTELEAAFWDYVVKNGGFSTCPSCGKKPFVNRRNSYSSYNSEGGSFTAVCYTEGLWNNYVRQDMGAVMTVVETINCCEHLWDLKTKKRHISLSAVVNPAATATSVGFRVQEKFCHWSERGREQFGYQQDEEYGRAGSTWRYNKMPRPQYVLFDCEDPDGSKAKAAAEEAAKQSKIAELKSQLVALQGSI